MGIFKKKNNEPAVKEPAPFDIGKNGTVAELIAANDKAFGRGDYAVRQELQRGAIEAFFDARPENIQTILAQEDKFSFSYLGRELVCETLSTLIKGSDYPSAIISLALEKVPEQQKQRVLNLTLYKVISSYTGDDAFVAALLKTGADANAEFSGFKGRILATAICRQQSQPLSVVELLHKNGAGFDDALFYAQVKNWEQEDIDKLKVYREKVTGQPATEAGEVLKTLNLLREEIAEMRKELTQRQPSPVTPISGTIPHEEKAKTPPKKNPPEKKTTSLIKGR